MPSIPDLSNGAWQKSVSSAQLTVSILDGKGTLMPAFRDRISDDQAEDLVAYVRSLGPVSTTPPEEKPAGDFEKRFMEVQAHRRELQRQLEELSKPSPKP